MKNQFSQRGEESSRAAANMIDVNVNAREILDHMLEGCQVLNFDWMYVYLNDSAIRHARLEREKLINHRIMDVYPGIEKTELFSHLKRCMDERIPRLLENEFIYPDGKKAWFELRIQPAHQGIFILSIDITERKQVTADLNVKEQLLSEAQQIGNIGSWEFDIEKNVLRFSDEMFSLLGVSEKDFKPSIPAFLNRVHPEDRKAMTMWIERGLSGKELGEINVRIFLPDGKVRYLHEKGRVVRNEKGQPARLVGISQDVTEFKSAQEFALRQIDYLRALRDIDRAIVSTFDMRMSLNALLSHAVPLLKVDAATVLLLNPALRVLEYGAGVGFRTRLVRSTMVRLEENYAGRAVIQNRMVKVPNLAEDPDNPFKTGSLSGEGFVSYYGAPLTSKGKVVGVFEVFSRSLIPRDQEWFDFFNTLVGQASLAVDNASLFDNLQRSHAELSLAYDATIQGWSRALDMRDHDTEGHTIRVTEMTIELARRMGIRDDEMAQVRRGALLHDIGKMGVPDGILLKPDTLTDEEWAIMKMHPVLAYEMIAPIRYLKNAAVDIPYCHHEKWDGSGYPRGLKGEQIPLAARLFAVVDVWDALTSDRPYRKGWKKEKVLNYIRGESGRHFDPRVVRIFLGLQANG